MRGTVTSVGGTDWSRRTMASNGCTPGSALYCKTATMCDKICLFYLVFCFDDKLFFVLPTQPTPTSKFLQGYVGAVTSAVSLAVSVFIFHHHLSLLQLQFIFTVTETGADVVHSKHFVS